MKPITIGLGLAVLATAACSVAAEPIEGDALALIELTRTTDATYSLFTWNWITEANAPAREEWGAEFHKGTLHRVETPNMRIVANCEQQIGAYLDLSTGERGSGSHVARAACGIHANARIVAARIVGHEAGRFGQADRVEVRDPDYLRTYTVTKNGALVSATIAEPSGRLLLRAEAMALTDTVPDRIFSEESLSTNAVPDNFRHHAAQ